MNASTTPVSVPSRFPLQLSTPSGIHPMALVVGLNVPPSIDAAYITINHRRVNDVDAQPADDAKRVDGFFLDHDNVAFFIRRERDRFIGIIQERRGSRTFPQGSTICKFRVGAVETMLRMAGANGTRTAVLDYPTTFADQETETSTISLSPQDAEIIRRLTAKSAQDQHLGQVETFLRGFQLYTQGIMRGQVRNPLSEVVIQLNEPADAIWVQSVSSLRKYWQT